MSEKRVSEKERLKTRPVKKSGRFNKKTHELKCFVHASHIVTPHSLPLPQPINQINIYKKAKLEKAEECGAKNKKCKRCCCL